MRPVADVSLLLLCKSYRRVKIMRFWHELVFVLLLYSIFLAQQQQRRKWTSKLLARWKTGLVEVIEVIFLIAKIHFECQLSELYELGPLTPPPIYLIRSKNNVLVIWMTKLKSESSYLVPVWSSSDPKLDHFWILNFPSLFSDWSIQKFWKNIL